MSEFRKWLSGQVDTTCEQEYLAEAAWNAAVDSIVSALKAKERLFRSKMEGTAVLNDLLRMKADTGVVSRPAE